MTYILLLDGFTNKYILSVIRDSFGVIIGYTTTTDSSLALSGSETQMTALAQELNSFVGVHPIKKPK